ncbi:unnamed protein product [Candidula unifasciata]|uniref:C-type lectin domain-containing protein n=1 Tax=Candidula unifasciata TaxID=100452 RepID=A0A8S3Z2X0_9EUPU|nr:unnamed protein product [Candidula unifasciata]
MWKICVCCFVIAIVSLSDVRSQEAVATLNAQNPCSHPNAISLPKDKKCLVPVATAASWIEASGICESAGGSLYETPDARLASRPELMQCLAEMSDTKYDDMWINAIGLWTPHFIWINGTLVNKVDYCTLQQPSEDSYVPIKSEYLSVDYCVSTCHDSGARYIILHRTGKFPECYCRKELQERYKLPCGVSAVDYGDQRGFYIVHSKEDSLIKISNANAFTRTDLLCATVNGETMRERQMGSNTCFTKNHFICCLGEKSSCVDESCFGPVCRFIMMDKCMLRVALEYNWYAARAYCTNLGGDLWNMHEFNEMAQVNQHLEPTSEYWIGATNYGWTFNGTSANFSSLPFNDATRVRCGHMFRERETFSSNSWQWSDADCTQQKAFLCQFDKTDFAAELNGSETVCPWRLVDPITPTLNFNSTTFFSVGNSTDFLENITVIPVTEQFVGVYGEESFPIAAVIAAIIAGIIMLTCLAVGLTWCSRSPWMSGGIRRVRERLAFIPYFADIPVVDYEGHGHMSSASDHGSEVGLVKGEYQTARSGFAMSSSYAEQSGMFASQSMDRRQEESMDRRLMGGNSNYIASGNSSANERGFAATNGGAMYSNARDLMTLQAQMNILDDAEVAALRESFRRKPEVALVTDNVDMNFTVNHAVSQGQVQALVGGDMVRSAEERTVEAVILPATEGGVALSLPERVVEEARIYSTLKTTYNI